MWYEWNTQQDFDNWHNALCAKLGYPITGINQATGLPDENAQKTTAYTTNQVIDNKVIAMVEIEYTDDLTATNLRPKILLEL
jgi:myosin-crossreactive antigen